jgi:hypothetical protein
MGGILGWAKLWKEEKKSEWKNRICVWKKMGFVAFLFLPRKKPRILSRNFCNMPTIKNEHVALFGQKKYLTLPFFFLCSFVGRAIDKPEDASS